MRSCKTSGCLLRSLVTIFAVSLLIFPISITLNGSETELGVDLGAEVEVEPEGDDLSHDVGSELEWTYGTGPFHFESETEFDPEGFSDQEMVFGFTGEELSGETDLDFDTELKELDSCEFSGTLDQDSKTTLEADYETDNCPLKDLRDPDRELKIEVERQVAERLDVEVLSTFSRESGSLVSTPEESEVEIDDLPYGNFRLTPKLEMEKLVPSEIEIGFERVVPSVESPRFGFEGDLEWEISEEYVEFDPELALEPVTLTLESRVSFTPESPDEIVEIMEMELDDLKLGEWGLELVLDFAREETEIEMETDEDTVGLELELLFEDFDDDFRPGFSRLGGGASLTLNESLEVAIEAETTFGSNHPELSISADYST